MILVGAIFRSAATATNCTDLTKVLNTDVGRQVELGQAPTYDFEYLFNFNFNFNLKMDLKVGSDKRTRLKKVQPYVYCFYYTIHIT